jgi:hypothetical protein
LTPQQITQSIADGIDAALKQYEARHPPMLSDNSSWWFSFWLVVFTGGLVVVGGAQCFLIFWTFKATQVAAEAAQRQGNILAAIEGPIPLVVALKLAQYEQIPGETLIVEQVPPGPIPANCRVLLGIENKGRNPT